MERLAGYELVEKIGHGGMAEVFLARRSTEGVERRLVIKRILPEFAGMPEFVQMFVNEARIAAGLEHPNITQLLDCGQADGTYFLAMEYVHGADFGTLLHRAASSGTPLPVEVALKVCALTCEALAYAHSLTDEQGEPLGFIHRDISPDNILLGYSGAVKVSDFGIAKVRTLPRVTQTGALKGKPHYAAPEYLRGRGIDHRADLFAVGVVLYESLTGAKPFDAGTLIDIVKTVVTQPTPDVRALRPDVPDAVKAIIERALQKDPAARYQSAQELQDHLEAAIAELGRPVTGRTLAELLTRYVPPRRALSTAAARSAPVTEPAPPPARPEPVSSGGFDRTFVRSEVRTAPARPRRASQWASAQEEEPATEPEEKLTPAMLAHRQALELADAPLPETSDLTNDPDAARVRKPLPWSTLVPVLLVTAGTFWAVQTFRPHPKPLKAGVKVEATNDGQLVIHTNTQSADVFVNNQLYGRAPLAKENDFPFGQRVKLDIRALGCAPVEAEIVGGRGQRVEAVLAPPVDEDE